MSRGDYDARAGPTDAYFAGSPQDLTKLAKASYC